MEPTSIWLYFADRIWTGKMSALPFQPQPMLCLSHLATVVPAVQHPVPPGCGTVIFTGILVAGLLVAASPSLDCALEQQFPQFTGSYAIFLKSGCLKYRCRLLLLCIILCIF